MGADNFSILLSSPSRSLVPVCLRWTKVWYTSTTVIGGKVSSDVMPLLVQNSPSNRRLLDAEQSFWMTWSATLVKWMLRSLADTSSGTAEFLHWFLFVNWLIADQTDFEFVLEESKSWKYFFLVARFCEFILFLNFFDSSWCPCFFNRSRRWIAFWRSADNHLGFAFCLSWLWRVHAYYRHH